MFSVLSHHFKASLIDHAGSLPVNKRNEYVPSALAMMMEETKIHRRRPKFIHSVEPKASFAIQMPVTSGKVDLSPGEN